MYKIDKNKIYSVTDVIKGTFKKDPDSSLKGYFINDLEPLKEGPAEFIAKAKYGELKQITDLSMFVFKASDGKWYNYFVPDDAVTLEYEWFPENKPKDFITLRDFLRIFDTNLKSKRRVEVFVWDDKEYDGLISDIPEDFEHLDEEVVSFSTYIDDGFSECGDRDYDKRTLTLEPVLSVFVEN